MDSFIKQLGWREWLCKSNFSFLIGASHPHELLHTSHSYGYKSLCFNDYDGVYGLARAFLDHKKLPHHDTMRLHFGSELHLKKDHQNPLYQQETLVFIATSHQGYFNLNQLINQSRLEGKHNPFLTYEQILQSNMHGLIAIQPMRGRIRHTQIQERDHLDYFAKLRDHLQGRLYFAISRHLHPVEDTWITPTYQLAQKLDCSILLSQDIFFHQAQEKLTSDLLHAIRHNKPISQCTEHMFANAQRCFHSLTQLSTIYSVIPGYQTALTKSHELAAQISFDFKQLKYNYPKEMIPEGHDPQSYLEALTWQCAQQHYSSNIPQKVKAILLHELQLVNQLQFADYFLTVHDIVQWARSQKILCQGRGSAANSAICFVLGITSINPNQFDLLFERFISAERGDPPDIDVDFEHERREEVIQYIYRRYGRDRAAMVCNIICFKSKGALRFVGKALGIDEAQINKGSQLLSSWSHRGNPLTQVIQTIQSESTASNIIDPHTLNLWGILSQRLRGFPRHVGIHSGGFMLADKSISWLCPQEPATMEGRTVIQWCKEDIEGLGFFKIDILALGGLTMIRKALSMIKDQHQINMTLQQIPADDPKTYQMIQQGDTVGTFQIESRAQISFLPRHKPRNFYDLVVEVAIIRPGPIQGGMIHPYLRRRDGLEPVHFPDPRLEPILKRTYGIPIFQEQVMRIAIAVGGFSPGEADALRKNIGSFNIKSNPEFWVEKLALGMKRNGINAQFIKGMIAQIQGFSSYGFPESHAASFALLAYATAYIKCHYPTIFFAALLNSQPMGFYNVDTLLRTAMHLGVKILPISIQKSHWDHQLEPYPNNTGYALRLGFRIIQGINTNTIKELITIRTIKGQWASLLDLLQQRKLTRVDLTALAAANALQDFSIPRRAALWLAEAAPYCQFLEDVDPIPLFKQENELMRVQQDYAATQTSLGAHPASLIKKYDWFYMLPVHRLILSKDLKLKPNGMVLYVFGMITCKQSPPTANGVKFITLWDETGSIDLIIKPKIYEQFRMQIDGQSFLCVQGRWQKNGEAGSLLVQHIFELQAKQAEVLPVVRQENSHIPNKRKTGS